METTHDSDEENDLPNLSSAVEAVVLDEMPEKVVLDSENNIEIQPSKHCLLDQDIEESCSSKSDKFGKKVQHTPVSYHKLKRIVWQDTVVPIVTQNTNGPCPIIAVANVLLLRKKIKFPSVLSCITAHQLLEYVGDTIVDSVPKGLNGSDLANYQQNMHDTLDVLPHLLTGLHVNIKFTGVRHFEYTRECIIFDLLNIPLYHGWLVDPQLTETVESLGSLGYNQVVEKIIANKSSPNEDLVTQALLAEQFLEKTASQLTYHGLYELNSAMKDGELAILFRNNHFSTIFKRKDEIFQLVTDQGYLDEVHIVWETIGNIEGDGQFVDGNFSEATPNVLSDNHSWNEKWKDTWEDEQFTQDCILALLLQEDQKVLHDNKLSPEEFMHSFNTNSDEILAHQLQELENNGTDRASVEGGDTEERPSRTPDTTVNVENDAASARASVPQATSNERSKKSACIVL